MLSVGLDRGNERVRVHGGRGSGVRWTGGIW